jgi:hypothetical protein
MLLYNLDGCGGNMWGDLESVTNFVLYLEVLKSYFWNYVFEKKNKDGA